MTVGAADAQAFGDRRLAQVLTVMKTMDLRPLVHVVHPFLLPSVNDGSVGRELLPVWEVSRFRLARGVNSSGGVDTRCMRSYRVTWSDMGARARSASSRCTRWISGRGSMRTHSRRYRTASSARPAT